ncbi:MAG: NDP-hexose 2,3-dehydratase family protein, partial [Actinomycetota bacterium]|nr:NDP-hexose 2,3-dehydratase family protein [Actinomycetota bacterium]
MTSASDARTSYRGGYLRSALADGGVTTFSDALDWFRGQVDARRATVREVGLCELPEWRWARDPLRLVHRTGRFFAVEGYRLSVSGVPWASGPPAPEVDQPLISQPEIGVLGFLTKRLKGTRHFLVQAKMEPGNARQVQLAPTVQATRSNYMRVHRGSSTPYLEFFLARRRSRVLVDELQPEQGAYFLAKRNRNMVVETDEEVAVGDRYCWMTLGHLKALLQMPYAVNMDARSVLSCLPLADETELAALSRPGREPVEAGGGLVGGYGRALLRSSS